MLSRPPQAPPVSIGFVFPSTAATLLLLFAGCAEMRWEKPGVDASTLDQDLLQCTQQARLDARREETPRLDSALIFRADPSGRPVVVPNPARDDRFLVEHDFISACMRGKDYELTRSDTKK